MKFIHLSDLHIGKRVKGFSMIEDQKYILEVILKHIKEEKPDGVIIAGDVYDKSVPTAEGVELLDDFMVKLVKLNQQVFIISGNHDSPERLAFGNRIMDASGIHISPVYAGHVEPITLTDQYGKVNIYMLPFIKPINVKKFYPEEEIDSYTKAAETAVKDMHIDTKERNLLVTHQFVTGAARSDSEEVSVGGSDNIDASVFEDFDYVALGHIHGPQNMMEGKIRYCGTPLKYSFSEAGNTKSITVVEMGEKGKVDIRTIPLKPLRDMIKIRGSFLEVTDPSFYRGKGYEEAYIGVTLTDEDYIPDVMAKLRTIYPNIMSLEYDNTRTSLKAEISAAENVEDKGPLELFKELYQMQNGRDLSQEQEEIMLDLIERIWG